MEWISRAQCLQWLVDKAKVKLGKHHSAAKSLVCSEL